MWLMVIRYYTSLLMLTSCYIWFNISSLLVQICTSIVFNIGSNVYFVIYILYLTLDSWESRLGGFGVLYFFVNNLVYRIIDYNSGLN